MAVLLLFLENSKKNLNFVSVNFDDVVLLFASLKVSSKAQVFLINQVVFLGF